MRVLREILRDTVSIARTLGGGRCGLREIAVAVAHDGSQVLALSRVRQALRRHHVPVVGGVLRRVQTAFFGVEIANDVELGEGVLFIHTSGIVIGGDSRIGDRVMFLGSNTIGSNKKDAYPRIGNDVVIGAGARVLGATSVGDGASIGANAVVLTDVPRGASAVGVPAVARVRRGEPSGVASAGDSAAER